MKGVDQAVNGGQAVLFGDVCQVGIARGCARAGMAEYRLNMAETQAIFEQVCGKTVP
jgi:hypothetical protein